jgi:diadenosine tetraphosphatase ApaH/serine/threonine PP2A family protein phosphatase
VETPPKNSVRILVLSDIHANLDALEACLEEAPAFDQVFDLGDLVGYGANPNEVTERSRQLGNIFVRGNHDKACSGISSTEGFNSTAGLAVEWTQNQLTPENLEFLRALPQGPIEPLAGVECVHGSARDEDEYVTIARDAYALLAESTFPLTFFGHTHIQCGYSLDKQTDLGQTLAPNYESSKGKQAFQIYLREGAAYMLNPGSVGQPRDNDPRAAFLLYDSGENAITFYRVPYDIAAAQKKIRSSGLPGRLAERLAEGR